jgi:hypothetical protein
MKRTQIDNNSTMSKRLKTTNDHFEKVENQKKIFDSEIFFFDLVYQ